MPGIPTPDTLHPRFVAMSEARSTGPTRSWSRSELERGRAHGARQRPRLLPGKAVAAGARSQPSRAFRSRDHERDGRARLSRLDDRGLWLRWRQLRLLRPDRTRGRARRQRLSLGDERAVEPGHVSDLRVRHRGAAAEISAQAGFGRMGRLLRSDRARSWLRPWRHDDARRATARRLSSERRQDVDHQRADRRCVRRLGQDRGRRDPRLHPGKGHDGAERAKDRGQVQPARLGHRRDRHGRRVRAGGEFAAGGQRAARPVLLPQQRALRHRLGGDRRGRILLARGARLYARSARSSAARSPPTS